MTIFFTTTEPQPPVEVRHVLQAWTESPDDACCGDHRDATPADLRAAGWVPADEMRGVEAERDKPEALFQQTHGCHWTWLNSAIERENEQLATAERERDALRGEVAGLDRSRRDAELREAVANKAQASASARAAEAESRAARLADELFRWKSLGRAVSQWRAGAPDELVEMAHNALDASHPLPGSAGSDAPGSLQKLEVTAIEQPAEPAPIRDYVDQFGASPADEAIVDAMVHRATAGRAVTRMQRSERSPWFPRPGERVRVTGVGSAGREFTVRDIDTAQGCPIIGEDGYQWRVSELEPVSSEQPATGGEERAAWHIEPARPTAICCDGECVAVTFDAYDADRIVEALNAQRQAPPPEASPSGTGPSSPLPWVARGSFENNGSFRILDANGGLVASKLSDRDATFLLRLANAWHEANRTKQAEQGGKGRCDGSCGRKPSAEGRSGERHRQDRAQSTALASARNERTGACTDGDETGGARTRCRRPR